MKDILRIILTPGCWIRNEKTCPILTKWLEDKLSNPDTEIAPANRHECKIDGVAIWISNYPYCYGHTSVPRVAGLPSRRVCFLLHDKLWELGIHRNPEPDQREADQRKALGIDQGVSA